MSTLDDSRVENKLPTIARVLSVILFVSTLIGVVGGLSLLWPGGIFDLLWKLNPAAQKEFARAGRLVAGLLLLGLGIGSCLAGIGLLRGRAWAWWLTLLLLVVSGAVNLVRLFTGDPGEFFGTPFTLALLWFHLRPRVRHFFLSA
jgi:hypothetical protein